MADDKEIEALRREVGELREELATLRRAIADARGRVRLTMKDQVRCPSCGARRIAHFKSVPDMAHGGIVEQGLHAQSGFWRVKIGAKLSALACTECGLVEYRVADTSIFERDLEDVEILTSEDPSSGPFR